MKITIRRLVLGLLTLVPITSIAHAAAIAKGRERNETDSSVAADDANGGDDEGSETDGNVSER